MKLEANLESLLDPIMPPEIVLMSTYTDLVNFEMEFGTNPGQKTNFTIA